ncbi:Cytochrome c oxidase subunit 1-like 16, partial [Homarus americanus]
IVGTSLKTGNSRAGWVQPRKPRGDDQIYNVVVTAHAFVIIFFLRAPDIAFPHVDNIKILTSSLLFNIISKRIVESGVGTGWTVCLTLSSNCSRSSSFTTLASCFSRSYYYTLNRSRNLNTSFFDPAGGGDPVLYQHLFWFWTSWGLHSYSSCFWYIISHIAPFKSTQNRELQSITSLSSWFIFSFTVGGLTGMILFFMAYIMLLLTFITFYLSKYHFLPQHFLGLNGMPRRYSGYLTHSPHEMFYLQLDQ